MFASLLESCSLQTFHYLVEQRKLIGCPSARRADFKMLLDVMHFLGRERPFRGVG